MSSSDATGDSKPAARSGMVALLGRPNVGKSTFLNQALGTKLSAVTPRPQTTRDRIMGVLDRGPHQLVFLDTPGVHRPRSELNKAMVEAAFSSIADSDAVLLMVEVSRLPRDARPAPGKAVSAILERLQAFGVPSVLGLNKVDRVPKEQVLPYIDVYKTLYDFESIVPLCARTGDGVDRVIDTLVPLLPYGPPLFPGDQISNRAERFFAGELIREQIFLKMQQEIPYSCAVVIDAFLEPRRESLKTEINATIVVERETHKRMMIGRGGDNVRELGQRSRESIEAFLGRPVVLRLYVKVRPNWSKDVKALQDMGYEP